MPPWYALGSANELVHIYLLVWPLHPLIDIGVPSNPVQFFFSFSLNFQENWLKNSLTLLFSIGVALPVWEILDPPLSCQGMHTNECSEDVTTATPMLLSPELV